jgi:hypothetical protein
VTTAVTAPTTTLGFVEPVGANDYKQEVSDINQKFLSVMNELEQAQASSGQPQTIDEQLAWTNNLKEAYGKALEAIRPLLMKAVAMKHPGNAQAFHTRLVTTISLGVTSLTA